MQLKKTFHVDRLTASYALSKYGLDPQRHLPCSTVNSVTSHLSNTFVEALSTPFYVITQARSGSEVQIK